MKVPLCGHSWGGGGGGGGRNATNLNLSHNNRRIHARARAHTQQQQQQRQQQNIGGYWACKHRHVTFHEMIMESKGGIIRMQILQLNLKMLRPTST